MLEIGCSYTVEGVVSEALTAKAMGSGELPVLATPAVIAGLEEAAWKSVADALEEGTGTVGTYMAFSHDAATPLGMKFRCESTLVSIDGRALEFHVEAFDEAGKIGSGTHRRFIISNDRFLEKTNRKGA
ncbi:MAG: thioesterase family protein [Lachnospiraceae bacterium]|nr:thioesterase family protein [Lachnospiraceae bacterium]